MNNIKSFLSKRTTCDLEDFNVYKFLFINGFFLLMNFIFAILFLITGAVYCCQSIINESILFEFIVSFVIISLGISFFVMIVCLIKEIKNKDMSIYDSIIFYPCEPILLVFTIVKLILLLCLFFVITDWFAIISFLILLIDIIVDFLVVK